MPTAADVRRNAEKIDALISSMTKVSDQQKDWLKTIIGGAIAGCLVVLFTVLISLAVGHSLMGTAH